MRISLVIPAYNEAKYLPRCLDSVAAYGAGKFAEVVVVDNASTDATAEIASRYEGVRVVRENEKGLTKARQRGLIETTGEFVAYIDADCAIPISWFDTLTRYIEAHPDAVSWSGPAYYYDAPSKFWNLKLVLGWWLTSPIMYRVVGYMIFGANFVVRRQAMESIGGFDPNVMFYGEDMTLAKRLHAVGKTIFRMDFYIMTSVRRFAREGYMTTNFHYVMNYTWPVLFGRPYTREYNDIR